VKLQICLSRAAQGEIFLLSCLFEEVQHEWQTWKALPQLCYELHQVHYFSILPLQGSEVESCTWRASVVAIDEFRRRTKARFLQL